MRTIFNIIYLFIIAIAFYCCSSSKPKISVENLKTAFNNESTASEKYAKFAQIANSEGFDTIAKLFDAASRSEKVHALNHAKVLEKFGAGDYPAEIGEYEMKTTSENLKAAIDGETYEQQSMYPQFVRKAEQEKTPDAAKSFTWAWDAEKKHLKYFRLAMAAITKGNEKGLPYIWYICPTCGNTYQSDDVKNTCDYCLTKKESFIGYAENPENEL